MRSLNLLKLSLAGIVVLPALLLGIAGCSEDDPVVEVEEEELYVLNEKSNTLSIYTAPGLERHGDDIATASSAPHHLHFDHSHVFYFIVGRVQNGFVDKYDTETNEHLATSAIAHYWTGVETSPDAQHVYVTDFGQQIDQPTKMYTLHVQDLSVVDSITCGSQPHFIAQTEDGETVVIVNAGSDNLTYYYPNGDPEDNVFNVNLDPDSAPFGQPVLSPYSIAIAHDDSLAYVCCRKSKWAGQSAIFVVDLVRRMTIDTILVPFVNRSGASTNYQMGLCMLIDEGHYLAVTTQDGNSALLVDLTDGSFEEAVVQHNITFGITANSDEDYLYVTANNGNLASTPGWVYEIKRDGGSLTVTDSVEVGLLPNGIHVRPGAHSHEH